MLNVKLNKYFKQMKHRNFLAFILLAIAVCIGFTSCDKDDGVKDLTSINQVIIGRWASQFIDDLSYVDTDELDLNDTNTDYVDSYLTFNSNGTGYEIDEYDREKYDFSYRITDGVVYMTAGNAFQSMKIIKFNSNVIYSLNQSEQTVFKLVKIK